MQDLSRTTAKLTRAVKRPERCILKRAVAGSYDPSTGSTAPGSEMEFDCDAIFSVSAGLRFDKHLKREGDFFARIDADTIQTTPQEGDTLHVIAPSTTFNVVSVKPFAGLGGLSDAPAFLLVVRA